MKAKIESTDTMLILGGLSLRVWAGEMEDGTHFVALVNRIEAIDPEKQPAIIKGLQSSTRIDAKDRETLVRMGAITAAVAGTIPLQPNSTPSTKG